MSLAYVRISLTVGPRLNTLVAPAEVCGPGLWNGLPLHPTVDSDGCWELF